MKKVFLFLSILILATSCGDAVVKKPEKAIDEETMVNIIYDLSVLEAMKSRNPSVLGDHSGSEYVYKKYAIDSLQFAQNSQYYASDVSKYKDIYDKVAARIDSDKNAADSIAKKKGQKAVPPANPGSRDLPQVK